MGVYADVVAASPVVGRDESQTRAEDWPPPFRVTDPITGEPSIYHRGEMRATGPGDDLKELEPAAVWDLNQIVERLSRDPL